MRISTADRWIATAIVVVAAIGGMGFLLSPAGSDPPGFPSGFCSTAVMIADGRGFIYPEVGAHPRLTAFIERDLESLDPAALPKELPTWDKEVFRDTHRYLLYTLGYTWRLLGVHWGAEKVLLGILYCITALLVYALFRLAMGRTFSTAGTLAFLFAPAVLTTLPSIRDFAKAPWLFAVILVFGLMLKRRQSRRQLFLGAVVLGALTGFGLGFRQDLLVGVPASVAFVLFAVRTRENAGWRHRAMAAALCLLVFYLPARPILEATEGAGTLMYHNIMNGMATDMEERMGLEGGSYELVYEMNDNFVHAIRTSFARRYLGSDRPFYNEGPDAAWAGKQYVMAVAMRFPADFLTRGLGTIRYLLGPAASGIAKHAMPDDPLVMRYRRIFRPLADHLAGFGVFYAAASLLMISVFDLRVAWILFFMVLYFGGYSVIQLEVRHCFPWIILGFWSALFFWARVLTGLRRLVDLSVRGALRHTLRECSPLWLRLRGPILHFALPATLMLVIPLLCARAYQYVRVGQLLEAYQSAQLIEIDAKEKQPDELGTGWVQLDVREGLPEPRIDEPSAWEWRTHEHYLVLEFTGDVTGCPIWLLYEGESPGLIFEELVYVGPSGGEDDEITRYFFPVYEFPASQWLGTSRFTGAALPAKYMHQLHAVRRVQNIADFPFLMNLTLPPKLKNFKRCKTL